MSVQPISGDAERELVTLPLSRIFRDPDQPRRVFDELALMELAASIRQHGLLQPITVRPAREGYRIIMGERRFRACQMLGHARIDCFVLTVTEREARFMALVENVQRAELHFFEEAEAYAALLAEGMTQEELAHRLGKSASFVANKARLLRLDETLRAYIAEQSLTERHARALLRLPDPGARMRVAVQAAQKRLSVQKTEELVARSLEKLPAKRRFISLARDYRLYANAIKNVVEQLRQTGLDARYTQHDRGDAVEISVILPKARA